MASAPRLQPTSLYGTGPAVNAAGLDTPDFSRIAGGLSQVAEMAARTQATQNQFTLGILDQQNKQSDSLLRMRMLNDQETQTEFSRTQQQAHTDALEAYKIRVLDNESVLQRMRADQESQRQEFGQTLELLKFQSDSEQRRVAVESAGLDLQLKKLTVNEVLTGKAAETELSQQLSDFNSSALDIEQHPERFLTAYQSLYASPAYSKLSKDVRAQAEMTYSKGSKTAISGLYGNQITVGALGAQLASSDVTKKAQAVAALSLNSGADPADIAGVSPAVAAMAKTWVGELPHDAAQRNQFYSASKDLNALKTQYTSARTRGDSTYELERQIKQKEVEVLSTLPSTSTFLRALVTSPSSAEPDKASAVHVVESANKFIDGQIAGVSASAAPDAEKAQILQRLNKAKTDFNLVSPDLLSIQATLLSKDSTDKDKYKAAIRYGTDLAPILSSVGLGDLPITALAPSDSLRSAADHGLSMLQTPKKTMSQYESDAMSTKSILDSSGGKAGVLGGAAEAIATLGASAGAEAIKVKYDFHSANSAAADVRSDSLKDQTDGYVELMALAKRRPDLFGGATEKQAADRLAYAAFSDELSGYVLNPRNPANLNQDGTTKSLLQVLQGAHTKYSDYGADTPGKFLPFLLDDNGGMPVLVPAVRARELMRPIAPPSPLMQRSTWSGAPSTAQPDLPAELPGKPLVSQKKP